jgi:hypothetical protein
VVQAVVETETHPDVTDTSESKAQPTNLTAI